MSLIQIQNLSFTYPASLAPVFQNVTLDIDTNWRLGLVGRNGRGKTTFLKLLLGELQGQGRIVASEAFEYFPLQPGDTTAHALEVARRTIAPFTQWEGDMQRFAEEATPEAMQQYGDIQEQYAAADGYVIDELIAAESGRLGITPDALRRPFNTLSGGEQVKLLLAALFLKKHRFLLIDEPTDHLDAEGRDTVARWLAEKSGFILVSHDRRFLDRAIDHVLSINRADIELQRGNYSSWRENRTRQDDFERAENQKLESSIAHLHRAAKRTERWSDNIEKSKFNRGQTYDHGAAAIDRGYVGHQAARMMQRSKAIERRREKEIEEKQSLLKNVEEAEPLRFHLLPSPKSRLLHAEGLALGFGARTLFKGLSFTVQTGDRVAVRGANGSGKSCLLKLLLGQLEPTAGTLHKMSGLVVSTLPQDTGFLRGSLQELAAKEGVEQSLFLAILRKLDFGREAFTRPMESYSMGQRKKVCLALSLAKPAHLFVWDEPLNYIDVLSREQIEAAVLASLPTIVLVEHDAAFVDNVATKYVDLV